MLLDEQCKSEMKSRVGYDLRMSRVSRFNNQYEYSVEVLIFYIHNLVAGTETCIIRHLDNLTDAERFSEGDLPGFEFSGELSGYDLLDNIRNYYEYANKGQVLTKDFYADDFRYFNECMSPLLFKDSLTAKITANPGVIMNTEAFLGECFAFIDLLCGDISKVFGEMPFILSELSKKNTICKGDFVIQKGSDSIVDNLFRNGVKYKVVELLNRIGKNYVRLDDGHGNSIVVNAEKVRRA